MCARSIYSLLATSWHVFKFKLIFTSFFLKQTVKAHENSDPAIHQLHPWKGLSELEVTWRVSCVIILNWHHNKFSHGGSYLICFDIIFISSFWISTSTSSMNWWSRVCEEVRSADPKLQDLNDTGQQQDIQWGPKIVRVAKARDLESDPRQITLTSYNIRTKR